MKCNRDSVTAPAIRLRADLRRVLNVFNNNNAVMSAISEKKFNTFSKKQVY